MILWLPNMELSSWMSLTRSPGEKPQMDATLVVKVFNRHCSNWWREPRSPSTLRTTGRLDRPHRLRATMVLVARTCRPHHLHPLPAGLTNILSTLGTFCSFSAVLSWAWRNTFWQECPNRPWALGQRLAEGDIRNRVLK